MSIACKQCTLLNPPNAMKCNVCGARLPKGRERDKAADNEAAKKRAREELASREAARKLAHEEAAKTTMEVDGDMYRGVDSFPPGWAELVERAAVATEALLEEDAQQERSERKLETINSVRRQLRFLPEGLSVRDVPSASRYVELTERHRAIHECARELQRQLGPARQGWVAQDLYVLHTPREEEGVKARAAQSWHLDAMKKFAVAALVLRGRHATEFPVGRYSDFSEGVDAEKLDEWTRFFRQDNAPTDEGREAESLEELEHFTKHLVAAGLTTGAYTANWAKLETAPLPEASPGFATCFWSNKVHRGPATALGEERLVLFCTWLPPGMARSRGPVRVGLRAGPRPTTRTRRVTWSLSFGSQPQQPRRPPPCLLRAARVRGPSATRADPHGRRRHTPSYAKPAWPRSRQQLAQDWLTTAQRESNAHVARRALLGARGQDAWTS